MDIYHRLVRIFWQVIICAGGTIAVQKYIRETDTGIKGVNEVEKEDDVKINGQRSRF